MPETQLGGYWYINGAWIAWAAIWVILSRQVKPAVRHESKVSRALHVGPLLIAAMLLFGGSYTGSVLSAPVLSRAAWMVFAGAAMVTVGLGFAVWARLAIGANWSGSVTVKQAHTLIETGPYAMARHPIYTGLLTALAGTAIAIDAWRGPLALVLVAVSFIRKMATEERFMVDTFGAEYIAYRARTAALVPFVW